MRKIPSFVLLRAFEAAARLQSFSLAAHELHLTPSAISHQVRELEQHFGRAMFARSHRRVDLTPEGHRLFASLARVLDALEACCDEVKLAAAGQVLAVHCAPSFAAKWLAPRLPAFAKAHPDVTIRLTTGADPVDLTRARELDVAITYGRAEPRPGVEVTPLGLERIAALCAPSLKRRGQSWREALETLPLIDSHLSQVTWRDWFALNGLALPDRPRQSFDGGRCRYRPPSTAWASRWKPADSPSANSLAAISSRREARCSSASSGSCTSSRTGPTSPTWTASGGSAHGFWTRPSRPRSPVRRSDAPAHVPHDLDAAP